MKKIFPALYILILASACVQKPELSPLPIAGKDGASQTLIISDIHLGIDDSFAENVQNRKYLIEFLNRAALTPSVKELVIAGDFLDEWIVPLGYPPHSNSSAFYFQIAKKNKEVIKTLRKIISAGKISVVYTPGNHDMLLESGTLSVILPGIKQARDVKGLGTYRIGGEHPIAIEHGHRYLISCAPDPFSNKKIVGSSLLPLGYFLAVLATTSFVQKNEREHSPYYYSLYPPKGGREEEGAPMHNIPNITKPLKTDKDGYNAYVYFRGMLGVIGYFPVKENWDEPVFDVSFNGFKDAYSISDLIPREQPGGEISAKLFANIQKNWGEVQKYNGVKVEIPYLQAIKGSISAEGTDKEALRQYFDAGEKEDIVIFGHTHVAKVQEFDYKGRKKIYANSGTWIDRNLTGPYTRTFLVLSQGSGKTAVEAYTYNTDGSLTSIPHSK